MIIYTCITNGYDEIPDSHYYDPDVQYVCFTDGTIEHKGPWEFREIPIEHDCPRRRSAYVKINPHKVFPKGSKVVWVDGCYQMTEKFVEQSRKYLETPFTIMRHPCKFSYLDEVLEGFLASMNSWDDVIEISTKLKEDGDYVFFKYCSPVLAYMWREVNDEYERFGDLWWEWSLIGPNRDQISFDYARQKTGMKLNILEDGWFAEGYGEDGLRKIGTVGVRFGTEGKVSRKKLHPKAGKPEQYNQRMEMLKALHPITGLLPKLYAKHDHMNFVRMNVINPYLPES